jgi:hypothetical protein
MITATINATAPITTPRVRLVEDLCDFAGLYLMSAPPLGPIKVGDPAAGHVIDNTSTMRLYESRPERARGQQLVIPGCELCTEERMTIQSET